MRSDQIFGAAALAVFIAIGGLGIGGLGIGGAQAATPLANLQARKALDIKNLMPAQTASTLPGLAQIANSKNTATPASTGVLAAVKSQANIGAHVADLRAAALAARFVPGHQSALNAVRDQLPASSSGLAGLKAAAGLPSTTAPDAQRLVAALAVAQPGGNAKRLSTLSAR